MRNIIRIADFADADAANVSAGGVITNGIDTSYFSQFNGMWKQIFTDQAGDAKAYRHTISQNGEATLAAQMALDATTALDAMRDMYNNIDPRAFEASDLVMQVTRSLFNNWVNFLEDKSLVFMLDRTEKGASKFSYRGIPIEVRNDWDRDLRMYYFNGTTIDRPHRAILASKSNIPVGTSDEESMSEFDSFYDKKDKKWYMDVAYKLDMKVLEEELIAVAY